MLKAIDKYDASTGAAFSSFAVPYIKGEIQHFLRDHWGQVKIPRRNFEKVAAVKKVQRTFQAAGREVGAEQVAAALGVPKTKWRWVAESVQRKPMTDIDDLAGVPSPDTDLDADRAALQQQLMRQLAALPKLQRLCVVERYFEQLSEAAIARRHQISLIQVHQLIESALSQLNTQLSEASNADCC